MKNFADFTSEYNQEILKANEDIMIEVFPPDNKEQLSTTEFHGRCFAVNQKFTLRILSMYHEWLSK